MGKKFVELDALSMMGALAELAEPIGNLADDEELWETFKECTEKALGLQRHERLRFGLRTYAKLCPLLLSEQHRHDTLRIMSIIEGKSVKELSKVDGAEFIFDMLEAWRGDLRAFFTRSGLTARKESSSP